LADSVVRIDGVRGTQESRTLVATEGSTLADVAFGEIVPVVDDLIYERGRWYFARRHFRSEAG